MWKQSLSVDAARRVTAELDQEGRHGGGGVRFARRDGERVKPKLSGERASCGVCEGEVLAKCGEIVIWHWAHVRGTDCDSWGESEGPWHRGWKDRLAPESHHEVTIDGGGQRHRADLVDQTGIVVELQHSPISLSMVREREAFYPTYAEGLVWLFDCRKQRTREHLPIGLPRVKSVDGYYSGSGRDGRGICRGSGWVSFGGGDPDEACAWTLDHAAYLGWSGSRPGWVGNTKCLAFLDVGDAVVELVLPGASFGDLCVRRLWEPETFAAMVRSGSMGQTYSDAGAYVAFVEGQRRRREQIRQEQEQKRREQEQERREQERREQERREQIRRIPQITFQEILRDMDAGYHEDRPKGWQEKAAERARKVELARQARRERYEWEEEQGRREQESPWQEELVFGAEAVAERKAEAERARQTEAEAERVRQIEAERVRRAEKWRVRQAQERETAEERVLLVRETVQKQIEAASRRVGRLMATMKCEPGAVYLNVQGSWCMNTWTRCVTHRQVRSAVLEAASSSVFIADAALEKYAGTLQRHLGRGL